MFQSNGQLLKFFNIENFFYRESDVWSFGITCWEIMANAKSPYGPMTNLEVISYVNSGKIIDQIPEIPNELFEIMKKKNI